ncbi:MAG TPA: hydrogenase expression/formation protein HypE [Candidatus Binatia bacterium]|nr:hydrogenase expression/formation protein HypE [Candidatus Binatia bacterium]
MSSERPGAGPASLATGLACPVPFTDTDRVLLGHGSGGTMTADLIARCFLPAFRNEYLARLDDQAVLPAAGGRLAFTTDAYVVTPLFFPGGDIGTLAVNGTVNDLAMAGARPLYLSAAFILEEGFPLGDLHRLVASARAAAERAGVLVVTGDTKVVERGKADGCFVVTSGLGVVEHAAAISSDRARPGDLVVLSGPIAAHGAAIMAARADLELDTPVVSDTAPLHRLVAAMLATGADLRCLRDPTRGGLATALNELADRSGVGIVLDERAIPVEEPVRGLLELLGLDPLYVANEGRLVAVVAARDADRLVARMREHPEGRQACIVGEVVADEDRLVVLETAVGGRRIVDRLAGDQLPRIC